MIGTSQFFADAQIELIFFLLAILSHLLFRTFFSRLKVNPKAQKVVDSPSTDRQQTSAAVSGSKVAAFKAALRANDIKTAMTSFEKLASLCQHEFPYALMDQLVKLAAKEAVLPDVLELVNKMGVLGKAFDMILNASADVGNADMLKATEELGRAQGVIFNCSTYKALIKGASNCGTMKDTQQVMAEAQKSGMLDLVTYFMYMKAMLKKCNTQEVERVMKTMRTAGLQPDAISFNGLLGVAVQTSTFDTAWALVEQMRAFDVKPDHVTCSILLKSITAHSKVSQLQLILGLLDKIATELDEVVLSSVVEATVRVGRPELLVSCLKKHGAKPGGRNHSSSHTYASIIRAYGLVHDVKGVWDTWNDMRRQNVLPIAVTLGCMVEALVTNQDIQGGYDLIQEMIADSKTAPLVNSVMYGSIVKGFSHKKCFDRVWELYEEMLERKLKFSMVTYNTFIDACARSGDLDRIPELLQGIEAQGLKMGVVTHSAIIKGYCQKNRLDEAFELAENMTTTTGLEPDEIIYNTLLDGCARQGFYDRGMELLAKMQKSGVRPSNFTLSVLVKLATRGKRLEKAFELSDELSSTYGFRLNVHVFANLIQACVNYRNLPRAIGVLERCLREGVRPDVRCYSLLLNGCIEMEQPEEAAGLLRLGTGLPEPHPSLAKYAGPKAQPQEGLPGSLASTVLSGMMRYDERRASSLFVELSRVHGLHLDPKLRMQFLKMSV